MADYEDNIQLAGALMAKIDVIITRDIHDFRNSPIPVENPATFLARFTQNTEQSEAD